jgi:hypothetical protein
VQQPLNSSATTNWRTQTLTQPQLNRISDAAQPPLGHLQPFPPFASCVTARQTKKQCTTATTTITYLTTNQTNVYHHLTASQQPHHHHNHTPARPMQQMFKHPSSTTGCTTGVQLEALFTGRMHQLCVLHSRLVASQHHPTAAQPPLSHSSTSNQLLP